MNFKVLIKQWFIAYHTRYWEGEDDDMVFGTKWGNSMWRQTKWGILHGEFGGCNTFGGNRDRRSWGRY